MKTNNYKFITSSITFNLLREKSTKFFKIYNHYYINNNNNNNHTILTFNSVTAFRVTIKGGGSGALAKKSAIGAFGGANNLACKQSSCMGVRKISGT